MATLKSLLAVLALVTGVFFLSGAIGARHDVVISFGSICCGPDMKAVTGIEALVGQYEDRHRGWLRVEKRYWGLEGEADYCIDFRGLAWRDRQEFVRKARTIVDASDHRTTLKENGVCTPDIRHGAAG